MIHELRTYALIPDRAAEFVSLTREVGFAIRTRHSRCLGYWTTEIGELNQVFHLWGYADLQARAEIRKAALADPVWKETVTNLGPLMQIMESKVLVPTDFSPLR